MKKTINLPWILSDQVINFKIFLYMNPYLWPLLWDGHLIYKHNFFFPNKIHEVHISKCLLL